MKKERCFFCGIPTDHTYVVHELSSVNGSYQFTFHASWCGQERMDALQHKEKSDRRRLKGTIE